MTRWLVAGLLALAATAVATGERFAVEPGGRIALVGNTFAERLALSGCFDALVHGAHPGHGLSVRSFPWSADEVGLRPREHRVPTLEDHLAAFDPDVVVMCFGMTESFAGEAGREPFRMALTALIESVAPARVILVSPIAHEDLGPPLPTGSAIEARNDMIRRYISMMRLVAVTTGARFVDLFLTVGDVPAMTSNGIHPTDAGCRHYARSIGLQLGWIDDQRVRGPASEGADVRRLAYDKHYHERLLYRATNSEYVWGRRHEPYGVVNFPPEMEQLERMIDARERALRAAELPAPEAMLAPSGPVPAPWESVPTSRDFPEDSWTPPPIVPKGTETSLGNVNIDSPDTFLASFTLPEGYAIECFASEQEIPELRNPLAMAFDAAGRLWVLCTPTYPHLLPGERPECMLIIIEDRDGDGRAETRTVFADHLYIPTGFALDVDGVYVGQAPDLWKLTDTDGDDRADRRKIVASGFGMPDSHHTISAFEWDPAGGILLHEGVFTKSNIETPYGPRRTDGAAVWRFDPRIERFEVLAHCYFNNPWGHAFDDFGQSVLADASAGENFAFAQVATAFEYPGKPERVGAFLNRGRPTAGCEIIDSPHFPEDVQGTFVVNQSIGFHGTRWDRLIPHGSAWRGEAMPQDLVASSDTNFRPVASKIGPDGALYIVDWCNPLIGHMQYSIRDPRRDHDHGRIWRVRHSERPLVEREPIASRVSDLLGQLVRLPRNDRHHARRRLQRAPATDVFPELARFAAGFDSGDPRHGRVVLEALWLHQAHGRVDAERVRAAAAHADARVRAGAVRVLRHWLQERNIAELDALPILERAVADDDMRVRLEAVQACGFVRRRAGAAIAAVAAEREMDDGIRIALEQTLAHLERYGAPDSAFVRRLRLRRAPPGELAEAPLDEVTAEVCLRRGDLPSARRAEALQFLARTTGRSAIAVLLDELAEPDLREGGDRALAALLLAQPVDRLAGHRPRLLFTAAADDPAIRAVAFAGVIRSGAPAPEELLADPGLSVTVLDHLEAGTAPAEVVNAVRDAVVAGHAEPRAAVEQVCRHQGLDPACRGWLESLVAAAAERDPTRLDRGHEAAMAALRVLNGDGAPDARFPVPAAGAESFARGQAIYADEIRGCARCHGADGRGEPGYPPLDRSPRVLGDARRAAAIVTHGLYGPLDLSDGRRISSVMEPLGALLDDEEVAAVLTFVRQSWGNYAPPVETTEVRAARALRTDGLPFSVEELASRFPTSQDRLVPVASAVAGTGRSSTTSSRAGLLALLAAIVAVGLVVLLIRVRGRSIDSSPRG